MTSRMHPALIVVFIASLSVSGAIAAPQLSLRVSPEAWIPYGNSSGLIKGGQELDLYSTGYGMDLSADLSLYGFLSPFLEAGANLIPINNVAGSSLLYASGGGGLAFYAYPLPRLLARAGASAGLAYASVPKTSLGDALAGLAPYWKAKAEFGYRFSPSFSLLANAGYSQLLGSESPIFKGLSLGLALDIGLDRLGGGSGGLGSEIQRQETLFPIAY